MWCQFSAIWMPQFSDLDVAINNIYIGHLASTQCQIFSLTGTNHLIHHWRHSLNRFFEKPSTLIQYFVLPLNGLEYYLGYTFKAIHILAILDPSTLLFSTKDHITQFR